MFSANPPGQDDEAAQAGNELGEVLPTVQNVYQGLLLYVALQNQRVHSLGPDHDEDGSLPRASLWVRSLEHFSSLIALQQLCVTNFQLEV